MCLSELNDFIMYDPFKYPSLKKEAIMLSISVFHSYSITALSSINIKYPATLRVYGCCLEKYQWNIYKIYKKKAKEKNVIEIFNTQWCRIHRHPTSTKPDDINFSLFFHTRINRRNIELVRWIPTKMKIKNYFR